jgi:hypothetical protein
VSNTYQKDRRRAQPERPLDEIAVPEQVVVSNAEIAESANESLLACQRALAAGTWLRVMAALFAKDADRPVGRQNPGREEYRHG